eukprot:tig00000158_g10183.t1
MTRHSSAAGYSEAGGGPSRQQLNAAPSAMLRAESDGLRSNKYEEVLFSILFAMADRSNASTGLFQTRALPVIFIFIDALQLAGLVNSTGWPQEFTDAMRRGPNVYQAVKDALFRNSFFAMFWAASALVLLIFVLIGWVWFTIRQQRVAASAVRAVRFLTKVAVSALYISILQIFTSTFTLGLEPGDEGFDPAPSEIKSVVWAVHGSIAALEIVSLILYGSLVSLVFVDFHPLSNNIEASAHGRLNFFYVACQTGLVFAGRFLYYYPKTLNGLVLAIAALNGVLVTWFQPYYSSRMNCYRTALFSCVSFYAAVSLWLSLLDERAGVVLSTALLIAAIVFAGASWALCHFRYRLLIRRAVRHAELLDAEAFEIHRNSALQRYFGITSGFFIEALVEVETRFIYEGLPGGRVPSLSEQDMDAGLARRSFRAETIYRRGIIRFPASSYVHINFATFVQYYQQNPLGAITELKQAAAKRPPLDERYRLSSKRLEWEHRSYADNINGETGGRSNFINVLEFRQLYDRAKENHNAALRQIKVFWSGLAKRVKKRHPLGDLSKQLRGIELPRKQAAELYETLLGKYPTSKILLRTYGSFLQIIENDTERAQELLTKADEIEEHEAISRARMDGNVATDANGRPIGDGASAAGQGRQHDEGSIASGSSRSSTGVQRAKKEKEQRRQNGSSHSASATPARVKVLELRAVKQLGVGIAVGLVAIGGIAAAMYGMVRMLFDSLFQIVGRLDNDAALRRALTANVYWMRMMQMYAYENNTKEFATIHNYFDARNKILETTSQGLYLTGLPGAPPSSHPRVIHTWTKMPVKTVMFVQSTTDLGSVAKKVVDLSLWEAVQRWVSQGRGLLALKMTDFHPPGIFQQENFNDLFENVRLGDSDRGINWALKQLSLAYAGEMVDTIAAAKTTLGGLFAAEVAIIAFTAIFVIRPAIRRVSSTKHGLGDLVHATPPSVIRQIAKWYREALFVDEEIASQGSSDSDGDSGSDGSGEGGQSDDDNADGSDVDLESPDRQQGEDGPDDEAMDRVVVVQDLDQDPESLDRPDVTLAMKGDSSGAGAGARARGRRQPARNGRSRRRSAESQAGRQSANEQQAPMSKDSKGKARRERSSSGLAERTVSSDLNVQQDAALFPNPKRVSINARRRALEHPTDAGRPGCERDTSDPVVVNLSPASLEMPDHDHMHDHEDVVSEFSPVQKLIKTPALIDPSAAGGVAPLTFARDFIYDPPSASSHVDATSTAPDNASGAVNEGPKSPSIPASSSSRSASFSHDPEPPARRSRQPKSAAGTSIPREDDGSAIPTMDLYLGASTGTLTPDRELDAPVGTGHDQPTRGRADSSQFAFATFEPLGSLSEVDTAAGLSELAAAAKKYAAPPPASLELGQRSPIVSFTGSGSVDVGRGLPTVGRRTRVLAGSQGHPPRSHSSSPLPLLAIGSGSAFAPTLPDRSQRRASILRNAAVHPSTLNPPAAMAATEPAAPPPPASSSVLSRFLAAFRARNPFAKADARAGGRKRNAPLAEDAIFRRMTMHYAIAFAILAAVCAINFAVCIFVLDTTSSIPAEARVAAERRTTLREVNFWALEVAANTGFPLPRREAARRLEEAIAEATRQHRALQFGDPELGTGRGDGRIAALDALMYKPGCLLIKEEECRTDKIKYRAEVSAGLNQAVRKLQDLDLKKT